MNRWAGLIAGVVVAAGLSVPGGSGQAVAEPRRAPDVPASKPVEVRPIDSSKGQEVLAKAMARWNAGADNHRKAIAEQRRLSTAEKASPSTEQGASLAADTSGTGNPTATPLSPSSSWAGGGSSGAFTWSYPMRVPPAAAGPQPSLSVSYDSGQVDGRTGVTNNQTSVLGEGFDLPMSYIERTYGSCHDDGHYGKFDLCWRGERLRLVLNGQASDLVADGKVDGEDVFRLAADDGTAVTRGTGANNGDNNGEYWKVVTSNGTAYTFGRNRLPGSTAEQATNSTLVVPVFIDDADDVGTETVGDCHDGVFAQASCRQAWRWNLDLVEDLNGNAATYRYEVEENYYARNGQESNPAAYDRGSYLTEIRYGLRAGALFAHAPQRVSLAYSERCIDPAPCTTLNDDTKGTWPDVPFDSICKKDATCKEDPAPTFFTRKRLTSLTTGVAAGSGYRNVDSWVFKHQWYDPGNVGDTTDQVLWLASIQHSGKAGENPIVTEPIRLNPNDDVLMPNRVDRPGDGLAPLLRPRLQQIISETGAVTDVRYSGQGCAADSLPNPANNKTRCFPVFWTPFGGDLGDNPDWFNKYRVDSVVATDTTTGDTINTSYRYEGDPAWRYDEDPMVANKHRTWSQWRGYSKVSTLLGVSDAPERAITTDTYLRGLDGNRKADGTTVSDSNDLNEWAGFLKESATYDGFTQDGTPDGKVGPLVSKTTHTPDESVETADHTFPGGSLNSGPNDDTPLPLGPVTIRALRVSTKTTVSTTRVTSESTPYTRSTTTEVKERDGLGFPLKVESWATPKDSDPSTTTDRRCARTWYAHNTGINLVGLMSRQQVVTKACVNLEDADRPADSSRPGDIISDTVTRYDGAGGWDGQTPSQGRVTATGRVRGYTGGTPDLQAVTENTYDSLGRPLTVSNVEGATTSTTYEPVGAGVPVSSTMKNAKGHETTTTVDPAWNTPIKVIDPNGKLTETTYDALGRVTAVWTPDSKREIGTPPDVKFGYHLGFGDAGNHTRANGSWISTATKKNDNETYLKSYEVFDALLRPRQTQQPSHQGGRLLTDTRYNSRGLVERTQSAAWDNENAPDGIRKELAYGGFIQTETIYDGANRATRAITSYNLPQPVNGDTREFRTTITSYTGDSVAVQPPSGGSGSRTITDTLGRVVERRQYAQESPSGTTYESTRFAYYLNGRLKTFTGPDSAQWTYGYDLFGRQTSATDPDRGASTTSYDQLDRVKTTTDEHSILSRSYDVLGRQTGLYIGTNTDPTTGNRLSGWAYDTADKGQLYSTTRYGGEYGAYTRRVLSYDAQYRPEITQLQLPANDPIVKRGGVPQQLNMAAQYNRDGTLHSTTEPAVAGLPIESPVYRYDDGGLGLPKSLTGVSSVVTDAYYDALGGIAQAELGMVSSNDRVWLGYHYDGLRRPYKFTATNTAASAHTIDLNYVYDKADQITSITDYSRSNPDYQCFTYGNYQRLTEAWTPKTSKVDPADSERNIADCDPAKRGVTDLGGKAPYSHSYRYGTGGQRSSLTRHATADGAELITNYAYDGTCTNTAGDTIDMGKHALRYTSSPGKGYKYHCTSDVGDTTNSFAPDGAARTTTWTPDGKLNTLHVAGKAYFEHVYDGDGNLLIKRPKGNRSGRTTLYVGATEVHVDQTGTDAADTYKAGAARYYSFGPVGTVAIRVHKPGTTGSTLQFLAGDHHGTVSARWSTASITTPAKRYTDPFGVARDPAGAAVDPTWIDDKRFIGKPHDNDTGLTHIGAREYDPALGRFLSVDPLLDTGDPQSVNGYTYADQDPINNFDPTGLSCEKYANVVPCHGSQATASGGNDPEPSGAEQLLTMGYSGGPSDPTLGGLVDPNAAPRIEERDRPWYGGVSSYLGGAFAGTIDLLPNVSGAMQMCGLQCRMAPEPVPNSELVKPQLREWGVDTEGWEYTAGYFLGIVGPGSVAGAGLKVATKVTAKLATRAAVKTAPAAANGGVTRVFRVESAGNARLSIDGGGNVRIKGDQTLFLNFGAEARAQQFLSKRLAQGYEGTTVKSFDVPNSYVAGIRSRSVPESMARGSSVFQVDTSATSGSFGLRSSEFDGLICAIIPGSAC